MPAAEDRQAKALEDIARSQKMLVRIFETVNTNLVQVGQSFIDFAQKFHEGCDHPPLGQDKPNTLGSSEEKPD